MKSEGVHGGAACPLEEMVVARTGWQGEILALFAGELGMDCERKQSGRWHKHFFWLSQWKDEIGKWWTGVSGEGSAGLGLERAGGQLGYESGSREGSGLEMEIWEL